MKQILLFCLTILITTPFLVMAEEVSPLDNFTPLIGINEPETGWSFSAYIDILYVFVISVAAFLVVVQIILAGLKYMLTDAILIKQDAKKSLQASVVGMLIIVGAVVILNTINPELTNLRALDLNDVTVVLQTVEVIEPRVAGPLQPYEGETLNRINCAGWSDGTGNCTAELNQCINELNGNPRSTIRDGVVFCYIPDFTRVVVDETGATTTVDFRIITEAECEGEYISERGVCYSEEPESCNGYFNESTAICYPAEDRVDLGRDDSGEPFDRQPARVKQTQCIALNPNNIWHDPYCYKPYTLTEL